MNVHSNYRGGGGTMGGRGEKVEMLVILVESRGIIFN